MAQVSISLASLLHLSSVQRSGGVGQWLGRRIVDQGVPGSNSGRCTFRCGLEQNNYMEGSGSATIK